MNLRTSQDVNEDASSPLLLSLPPEVQKEIYLYCGLNGLRFFSIASKETEARTAFLRLLPSVLDAEPEFYKWESDKPMDETKLAAIAILKRHPELLFEGGSVIDHFGRKIRGSSYRLFLGTGDVWAQKQVHEEIIAKIEGQEARESVEAQTKAQFQAQFPDYKGPWPPDPDMPEEALYDERNKRQIEQVIDQLKVIVKKITADPCTNGQATKDETTEAVTNLCKIFAPKEGEIIETGLHFPLGILKEIGKVYDAQFALWSSDHQLSFFSRTVIGGAVAALSAVDGQCVKNGLANLNIEKGPDRRDGLFCRHPKGIPEDKAPLIGKLGHTMFVDPYDGYSCFTSSTPRVFSWYNKNGVAIRVGLSCVVPFRVGERLLENLWRKKAAYYGSYYAAVRKEINTLSC